MVDRWILSFSYFSFSYSRKREGDCSHFSFLLLSFFWFSFLQYRTIWWWWRVWRRRRDRWWWGRGWGWGEWKKHENSFTYCFYLWKNDLLYFIYYLLFFSSENLRIKLPLFRLYFILCVYPFPDWISV